MASQEITPTTEPERVIHRAPEVDVFEDEQALYVTADVPGVAAGDVQVDIENGVLTLSGRAARGGATAAYGFRRRFTLADAGRYATDQISAVLRHGVLELRLPKAERAKPRRIPVTVN